MSKHRTGITIRPFVITRIFSSRQLASLLLRPSPHYCQCTQCAHGLLHSYIRIASPLRSCKSGISAQSEAYIWMKGRLSVVLLLCSVCINWLRSHAQEVKDTEGMCVSSAGLITECGSS